MYEKKEKKTPFAAQSIFNSNKIAPESRRMMKNGYTNATHTQNEGQVSY